MGYTPHDHFNWDNYDALKSRYFIFRPKFLPTVNPPFTENGGTRFDSTGAHPRKAVYEEEFKKKMDEYKEAKYPRHPEDDWAKKKMHARFPEFNWLHTTAFVVSETETRDVS